MRVLLAVLVIAACGEAFAADPPAKKTEPPYALLEFSRDKKLDTWTTTFELTTASGATYEVAVDFGDHGNAYGDDTLKALLAVNWMVEPAERSVKIYGVRNKDGSADALKTLTITNKLRGGVGRMPALTAFNDAKVEVKIDDGKVELDPKRKVPPQGPEFRAETFVEFDFSTLPPGTDGVTWRITWEVRTTAGKEEPWLQIPMDVTSVKAARNLTTATDLLFAGAGFKAGVIDKTKVRVYGAVYEGRYYPAEKGIFTSPHLKPEQLPKITNPSRS